MICYKVHEINLISEQIYRNVVSGFYNRLAYCQEVQGQQFEHLMSYFVDILDCLSWPGLRPILP